MSANHIAHYERFAVTLPDTLFRREVVEFQQLEKEWGGIVLLQPVSTRIMTWSITAALVVIVTFLSLAQYARKESVVGYLTLSSGRAKIFVPQHGIIKRVHVKEGDLVNEGQPLLTIETAQITSDGQDVNTSMLGTLTSQREMLAQQVVAEERRTLSERARLITQLKGLETEIANLERMIQVQKDRIQIFRNFVSSAEQLKAKGYGSEVEYRRRQQELLEQEQNLNSLNQQVAARGNQLTEVRYNLEQLPTLMAQKVQLLRNELSDVDQKIAQVNSRRAYNVRAPTAGRISALQATAGQTADPRHLQMEVVPTNSVLRAELFIPTRAIGFVEEGQDVRLLYEAFPYQKFGTYRAQIVQVSKTVLTGSDISAPVTLREPAYKAIAALDRADIDADGKTVPLQADMLLTADIILEKRSILSWFFNSVISARNVVDTEGVGPSLKNWLEQLWDVKDTVKAWLAEAGILDREAKLPESGSAGHL